MGLCPSPHPLLPGRGGRQSQDPEPGAWLPPGTLLLPGAVFPGANSAEASQPAAPCLWAPAARSLGSGCGVTTQPEAQVQGQGAAPALLRPLPVSRRGAHRVLTALPPLVCLGAPFLLRGHPHPGALSKFSHSRGRTSPHELGGVLPLCLLSAFLLHLPTLGPPSLSSYGNDCCALTVPQPVPTWSELRGTWTRPCGALSFTKSTTGRWSPRLTGTAVCPLPGDSSNR